MKKIFNLCVLCFLLCNALESKTISRYGNKTRVVNKNKQQNITPPLANQIIAELGIGMEYYKYKEPNVMQITGPMMNFNGTIGVIRKLFRFQTDLYFATHVGANVYDGGLYDHTTQTTTAYSTKSTDYYTGVTTKFGMTFFEMKKELFFGYIGLGYRFLHNLSIDKPGIKASYDRYQGYLFLPIGVSGEVPLNPKVSFIGAIEQRILLFGHNTSTFSDIGYDKDLYFEQKMGYGGRITFGAKIYLQNAGALKISAYYDYWKIEDSNIVPAYQQGVFIGNFVEPKNYTNTFGINLTYAF